MLERVRDLFKLTVAVAFVLLLNLSAYAVSSNCICYYVGDCVYDQQGGMYRYYQCTGSCYYYSGYRYEPRCASRKTNDSLVYDKIELV